MTNNFLGITELEDKQIEALSLGASPKEVAALSQQSVEDIPQEIDSLYDEQFDLVPPKTASREALATALAAERNVQEDYKRIYEQLTRTGVSPTKESLDRNLEEEQAFILQDQIRQVARSGDIEGTRQAFNTYNSDLEAASDPHYLGLQKALQNYVTKSSDARADEYYDIFIEELRKESKVKNVLNSIIDSEIANSTGNMSKAYLQSLESATPLMLATTMSKVGKDILGERYIVKHGSLFRDLARKVRNLPASEREKELVKVVGSVTKHSGFDTYKDKRTNDLVKVYALETLRGFLDAPGGEDEFTRILGDIFGLVDIVGVLPVGAGVKFAKNLLKLKRSSTAPIQSSSVLPGLKEASPEMEASIISSTLKDPKKAEKLATTPAEQLSKTLPSLSLGDDLILDKAPKSVYEKVSGMLTEAEEASEYVDNVFLYSTPVFKEGMRRIINTLSDTAESVQAKPASSTWKQDREGNRLIVNALYGDETDLPLTETKALNLQRKLNDSFKDYYDDFETELVVKDNMLSSYSATGEGNKYLVSVKLKDHLVPADALTTGLVGDSNTKGIGTVVGQNISTTLKDPNTYISQRLLNAARIAHDQKFAKEEDLRRLVSPFLNLGFNSKRRVANLLKEGEDREKIFKYTELEGKYTKSEIEGYYSARILNEALYNIKNADQRAKLLKDGWSGLTIPFEGGGLQNGFRAVDHGNIVKNAKEIFDPATKVKYPATTKKLLELEAKGYKVGSLLNAIDNGSERFTFVAVKAENIHTLPQRVLAYRKGYNHKINKDPYYIDLVSIKRTNGNIGAPHTSTIYSARNYKEARETVEKLKRNAPWDEYNIRLDRNLNNRDTILQNDLDILGNGGPQFWFSRRGEHLKRLSDKSLSKVEDPISAINKMISATANVKTHGELLEVFTATHRAKYGKLKGTDNKPLWYFDKETSTWRFDKTSARSVDGPLIAAALDEYEYLENLKYAPTAVDKWWFDRLESIDAMFGKVSLPKWSGKTGKWIEGKISNTSTFFTSKASSLTPGRITRGAAFSLTLPLRPFRQLLLQSTTGLSLAGIDPEAVGKAFKDTPLIMGALATWQKPKMWQATKQLAKISGYSPEEFEQVFTAFRKSGKAYSIDSHVAVGEVNFSWSRSLPESVLGEVSRRALNTLKAPITGGKAVGFDTGELINQIATYLFSVERWKKANPGKVWYKSKKAKQEIAAAARNYSVDMTKTSSFSYQKGAFASMTQFMAINHKMGLKILGYDPAIQGTDRAKYIAGLAVMYGSASLGMTEVYDRWSKSLDVELDPTLDDILQGGLFQALFNRSLEIAFQADYGKVRLATSASTAPTGGVSTFAVDLAKAMFEGSGDSVLEVLQGPSANTFKAIGETARYMSDLWGFNDISTPEKLLKSFQIASQNFGSFSDYYKYNMTVAYHDKMGDLMIVDKKGKPTVIANSWAEVFGKHLFAINTRGEQELYETWLTESKEYTSSGKVNEAEIDKDAKHLSKYLYKKYTEIDDEIKFLEEAKAITWSLHRGNPIYGASVLEKARAHMAVDPRYNELILGVISDKSRQMVNSEMNFDDMRNAVRNSDFLPNENKEKVIFAIDQLQTSKGFADDIFEEIMK